MEVVSGNNWSYKTCKAPVKSSPPTNQHPVRLQAGCPFCRPTNSVKALKRKMNWWYCWVLISHGVSSTALSLTAHLSLSLSLSLCDVRISWLNVADCGHYEQQLHRRRQWSVEKWAVVCAVHCDWRRGVYTDVRRLARQSPEHCTVRRCMVRCHYICTPAAGSGSGRQCWLFYDHYCGSARAAVRDVFYSISIRPSVCRWLALLLLLLLLLLTLCYLVQTFILQQIF